MRSTCRSTREFDAVFSNAALHWVRDHDAMLAGVYRALKPGGRFVAEFGGHGNIAAIQVAIRSVLARRGWKTNIHRYYATPAEYSARLEAHGFTVKEIDLIPRPTPLPTGMRGWLRDIRARDTGPYSRDRAGGVHPRGRGSAARGGLRLDRETGPPTTSGSASSRLPTLIPNP